MASITADARVRRLPSAALDSAVTAALGTDWQRGLRVRRLRGHSNVVTKLVLQDGRTLLVKEGRFAWARERFAAARAAASLLRRRTGIVAPQHLELPGELEGTPVEAYWWVPLPTLKEVWPRVPEAVRPRVLRSWGVLARRVHGIRLQGFGRLPRAEKRPGSLVAFLAADIGERLLPAVRGGYPDVVDAVEALHRHLPDVAARAEGRAASLLHNDLHMGNVLCAWKGYRPDCVGVIDLEDALAGPAELDLARLEVLHGPLLGQPLAPELFQHIREGYARPLDPALLAFFRAYHLANIGFHAALIGYAEHARTLAKAARAETLGLVAHLREAPDRERIPA